MAIEASHRIAAIELNIPHGPKASYALLGAELVSSDRDGLEVAVSVNSLGLPFNSSLTLEPDEVKVGLLGEYSGSVVRGVEKIAESSGLPTGGSLQYRWAAHSFVDSSPFIFGYVAGLVARLLVFPSENPEEDMIALFG